MAVKDRSSRIGRIASLWVLAAAAMLLIPPFISSDAHAADIPHENYDLVGSNLNVVISLLNSTIHYSELALESMYDENMPLVDQNLTVVRGLLTPAEQILNRIRNIAGSYANLSLLLPPFVSLSSGMDTFSSMETSLLDVQAMLVSASQLAGLTGDQLLEALRTIQRFNSLVFQMNRTIDDMLASANRIVALVVDGQRPFSENQLIPLIERLRDLLNRINAEMEVIIHEKIPWTKTQPFLSLWLSAPRYYLGESMIGGGYLYLNGNFTSGYDVDILMDGGNLTTASTTAGGRYSFTHLIPLNSSWLGSHVVQAHSITPAGPLSSAPVAVQISLVPTSISLNVNTTEMSIDDQLRADVKLTDVREEPVPDARCHFVLDGSRADFTTDSAGTHEGLWHSSVFGYGTHHIQAIYDGELPYASSSSLVVNFTVDIPTEITLMLFTDRIFINQYVIGNGTLVANGTAPMAGQRITLSIDGTMVANITTGVEGDFAFRLPAANLTFGGHTLKAELLFRDGIWRYSMDDLGFSVHGLKTVKYPFFPFFPHWQRIFSPDTITYLFIGPNAYFFWLLILVLIGVTVVLQQRRSRRAGLITAAQSDVIETLDKPVPEASSNLALAEGLSTELAKASEIPGTPNERVILYYRRLLRFLGKRWNVAFKSSMTHWEVARMLRSLGFPWIPVEKATVLFELALYSGHELTDEDSVQMSNALTNLVSVRNPEVTNAG